jgi:hypothetical protein
MEHSELVQRPIQLVVAGGEGERAMERWSDAQQNRGSGEVRLIEMGSHQEHEGN